MLNVGDRVRVVYRKYDGRLHWHQWTRYLGEDEYGVWVGAPAGSTSQRGDELTLTWEQAGVVLFPRDQWYTASFNDPPMPTMIYCDVTTPAVVGDEEITMIDLDLDVVVRRDGHSYIDDEDEFAEHQVRYGYPADVVAAARASADRLFAAVRTQEPFLTVHDKYLAQVR